MFNSIDGGDKRQVKPSEHLFNDRIRWCAQEAHLDGEEARQAREEAQNITKLTQQAKAKARQAIEEARQAKEKIEQVKKKFGWLVNEAGSREF
jgi:methyl-accepting chemotaxis protein